MSLLETHTVVLAHVVAVSRTRDESILGMVTNAVPCISMKSPSPGARAVK
jgi:hypothetical protein